MELTEQIENIIRRIETLTSPTTIILAIVGLTFIIFLANFLADIAVKN